MTLAATNTVLLGAGLSVTAVLVLLQSLVLVEMVKQVAQLRQRVDLDDNPMPVSLGSRAGADFARVDLIDGRPAIVVFLSAECSSCKEVGSAIAGMPARIGELVRVLPVIEGIDQIAVDDFLRETLLSNREVVVDFERELAHDVGLTLRPAAVLVRNGAMVEAAAVRTGHQMKVLVEKVVGHLSATSAPFGKAGVLLTGGLVALAVPATAMARNVACCTLAYDTDCPSNDVCRSCQSLWEWTCGPYGGAYWVCQECYTGTCSGCSKAFILRPGAPAR
jgi:hypothetical protein